MRLTIIFFVALVSLAHGLRRPPVYMYRSRVHRYPVRRLPVYKLPVQRYPTIRRFPAVRRIPAVNSPAVNSPAVNSPAVPSLPKPKDFNGKPFCDGLNQSPVNIVTENVVSNPSLGNIKYTGFVTQGSRPLTLINTGVHAEVRNFEPNIFIEGGGLPAKTYQLLQLHFHTATDSRRGSENGIDGNFFPAEMHLVFFNKDYPSIEEAINRPQGLAVLAVLFQINQADNVAYNPIVNQLDKIRRQGSSTSLPPFRLRDLLPRNIRNFYRFRGSLTTPSCFESVVWTVYKDFAKISERQMSVFRTALTREENGTVVPLVNNFRAPQNLNGRLVEQNTNAVSPLQCRCGNADCADRNICGFETY